MKKLFSIITSATLLLVLTACGSKIVLEEDQMLFVYDEDGGVTMSILMDDKDLEEEYDIDFDDKEKDIIEDIEDELDDEDYDIELVEFKKEDDTGYLEVYVEDADDVLGEIEDTLEDYADDTYGDFDDFAEEEAFVYFKNDEDVDEDDLEDYEDLLVAYVYAGDEGAYYTFPSKIVLVHDSIRYEKIDDRTIYVKKADNWVSLVVIEDY